MKKDRFSHENYSLIMKVRSNNNYWQVVDGHTVIAPASKEQYISALELTGLGYFEELKLRNRSYFVPTEKLNKYWEEKV